MPPARPLRPWMLVSAAWVVPAILGGLDAFAQQTILGRPAELPRRHLLGTRLAAVWPPHAVRVRAGAALPTLTRAPRRERPPPSSRFHFSSAPPGPRAARSSSFVLQPDTLTDGVGKFYTSWLFTTLPFGVAVYLAVVGIEHATHYFLEARAHETQVARLPGCSRAPSSPRSRPSSTRTSCSIA